MRTVVHSGNCVFSAHKSFYDNFHSTSSLTFDFCNVLQLEWSAVSTRRCKEAKAVSETVGRTILRFILLKGASLEEWRNHKVILPLVFGDSVANELGINNDTDKALVRGNSLY